MRFTKFKLSTTPEDRSLSKQTPNTDTCATPRATVSIYLRECPTAEKNPAKGGLKDRHHSCKLRSNQPPLRRGIERLESRWACMRELVIIIFTNTRLRFTEDQALLPLLKQGLLPST